MIGFFSLFKDNENIVKKDKLYFVSIPDKLSDDEIKVCFSQVAKVFADQLDANKVFLNYGKEKYIEYDYSL